MVPNRGRGNPSSSLHPKHELSFPLNADGLPSVGGQPAASWTINCFIETRPDCGSERHSFTKEEASSLCGQRWRARANSPPPAAYRHPGFETSFTENDIRRVYASCHEYGEGKWLFKNDSMSHKHRLSIFLQQLMGSRAQEKL